MPAGNGFSVSVNINDHVNCQGTIVSDDGSMFNGLTVSGTGQADVYGVAVNDATSGISGGLLRAAYCNVGSSGTGSFTQSGGTNSLIFGLDLGTYISDSGTYA